MKQSETDACSLAQNERPVAATGRASHVISERVGRLDQIGARRGRRKVSVRKANTIHDFLSTLWASYLVVSTMTSPSSTMKTLQKRFYTALPRATSAVSRVRSNSASSRSLYTASLSGSYFDATPPPPPSSRPANPPLLTSVRLPAQANGEAEGQLQTPNGHPANQPSGSSSLAFVPSAVQPNYGHGYPSHIFPFSQLASGAFLSAHKQSSTDVPPNTRRTRTKYQLDVGAYGIPKRCKGNSQTTPTSGRKTTNDSLAVQVGEDAYFVKDRAMGVADGVGGWAKHGKTSMS